MPSPEVQPPGTSADAVGPVTPAHLAALISNQDIPKLYMQNAVNFASSIDISVVVVNGGAPTGVVTMTYNAAKSLTEALNNLIEKYEEVMGTKVLSPHEGNLKMTPTSGSQAK